MSVRLHLDGEDLIVEQVQDVEAIVEHNKILRDQPQHGRDFHHKWNLPNVMVARFYNEYNDGLAECRPMNAEFWQFVDRKMNDPDYAAFRADNKANPFHMGYGK